MASDPRGVEYCCPRCKGSLVSRPLAYACEACAADYPVVLDIADFRVFPDPFIEREADWEKGARLAAYAANSDFKGTLEQYWTLTPETPPELAQRYLRHDSVGVARGRSALATAATALGAPLEARHRVIEIGCRAGGGLVAAAGAGSHVVGVDIAFRWLIVARKRLDEAGLVAQLVCACAQFLPFRAGLADVVVAGNVLEHTADPARLMAEAHRVLRPGGAFVAITWNRFSLAPEPHVRLLGVGFLPRTLMRGYVRLRRGVSYEHVRLVSLPELRRLVARSPFGQGRVASASLDPGELEGLSGNERRMARLYGRLRGWPLLGWLIRLLGPLLEVTCMKRDGVTT